MTTIDTFIPAIGLIIVLSTVTVRRRTTTNVSYGSGFIVDGVLENGILRNNTSTTNPIVVSVAHVIPTNGTNRYFLKLFNNQSTEISNIYELNLIAFNRTTDLCLFGIMTPNLPSDQLCLQWNIDDIRIGSSCYVAGFPLGNAQLSIAGGSVRDPTYCFSNLATGIDQIYHSVPTTNGNSGSCILDHSGCIIGIHAWGLLQSSNMAFENFCGGPSTKCAFSIVSQMIAQPQNVVNKYYARYGLGVQTRIIDDVLRIVNFNNQNIKDIDGVMIEAIVANPRNTNLYTVDTYNKNPQTTPKISVNDIITHIYDNVDDVWIPVGYSKVSPGLVLFKNTQSSTTSLKIKIRKFPYNTESIITFNNIYKIPQSIDQTNNRIL